MLPISDQIQITGNKILWWLLIEAWWRLPIEERACRKTDLGGGDYYLRNIWTPSLDQTAGPIGLKFFVDTHGWPGGVIG